MAPPQRQVDWMALSLGSREAVLHISMREAAGFSLGEIADVLDRDRPELRHLELPPKVTKSWLQQRMRDGRRERAAKLAEAAVGRLL